LERNRELDALVEIRDLRDRDVVACFTLRRRAEAECPAFVGLNVKRELAAERELVAGHAGLGTLLAKYRAEGTVVLGACDGPRLGDKSIGTNDADSLLRRLRGAKQDGSACC
jgi:hypothetical protein